MKKKFLNNRLIFLAFVLSVFSQGLGFDYKSHNIKLIDGTPTSAFLGSPWVQSQFGNYLFNNIQKPLKNYSNIINNAIAKEAKFKNTHHVFYHGMDYSFRVIQDIISLLKLGRIPKDFVYLRNPSVNYGKLPNLAQWINIIENQFGPFNNLIKNQAGDFVTAPYLLSVNLSIFGNMSRPGSNTFKYFVQNNSAKPPTLGSMINSIISKYVKDSQCTAHIVSVLMLLIEKIKTAEGNLLQIFIPKDIIDKYAYLSKAQGYLFKDSIALLNGQIINNPRLSEILEIYKKYPQFLGATIDMLEARLFITKDILLNPNSGVKIFRYSTLNKNREKKYYDIINKIVNYIKRKSGINKQQAQVRKLKAAIPVLKKKKNQDPIYYNKILQALRKKIFSIENSLAKKSRIGKASLKINKIDVSFKDIVENFKKYKTTNVNHHSGDLYEHSVWTSNAIEKWFNSNKFWVNGLTNNDKRLAVYAGFFHDIGKAGDLNYTFKTKDNHPRIGFEYLINKRPYILNKNMQIANFDSLFKNLNLSAEERKIIAILTGIHWDFGAILIGISNNINKNILFNNFLKKLENLVKEAKYNHGKLNERIVKLAILIGAADLKGACCVKLDLNMLGLPKAKKTHEANIKPYKHYKIKKIGKKVRIELLEYFKAHPNNYFDLLNLSKNPKTQSEAHLKVGYIKDELYHKYDVQKYNKLISRILSRERKNSAKHYVFYHSSRIEFYVLQDLILGLYKSLYPLSSNLEHFKPLRFPRATLFDTYNSTSDFIKDKLVKYNEIDDSDMQTRTHILSANLSLFGNLGIPQECSFDYFVNNKSNLNLDLVQVVYTALSGFGDNKLIWIALHHLNELNNLINSIKRKEGFIMQIFIPKQKVDDYVYLARNWGKPFGNQQALGILFNRVIPVKYRTALFWKLFEKNATQLLDSGKGYKPSKILPCYIQNPVQIPNFNLLQARILINNKMLLHPTNGVKIFRYNTLQANEIKLYKERLEKLIRKITSQFLASNASS